MAAPLAFGAVEAWAWASVTVVAVVIAVLWAVGCVRSGTVQLLWSPLLIPAMLLLALAVVQFATGISQDPIATRESIIKLITDLLLFLLTLQLFSEASPRIWHWTGVAVSGYAFAIAMFAIIQFFSSPGLVYWTIKPRWGGYVFGPYISHNNYAGLMEMVIPLCVASVLSLRERHPLKPFLLFAVVVATASLLLSGSRGGLIALAVELGLFLATGTLGAATTRAWGKVAVAGIAIVATVVVLFMWLDSGDVWKRWQVAANTPEIAMEDRNSMAVDSLRMSRDHLSWGVGLGAFETAYPKYQSITTDKLIDFAHNDYAQLFAEMGILGWVLAPLSIALFTALAFRRLRSRLGQPIGWMQLGAAAGVCGILVHSLFDFNLHIPANAAWFAVLAALAVVPRSDARDALRSNASH